MRIIYFKVSNSPLGPLGAKETPHIHTLTSQVLGISLITLFFPHVAHSSNDFLLVSVAENFKARISGPPELEIHWESGRYPCLTLSKMPENNAQR